MIFYHFCKPIHTITSDTIIPGLVWYLKSNVFTSTNPAQWHDTIINYSLLYHIIPLHWRTWDQRKLIFSGVINILYSATSRNTHLQRIILQKECATQRIWQYLWKQLISRAKYFQNSVWTTWKQVYMDLHFITFRWRRDHSRHLII